MGKNRETKARAVPLFVAAVMALCRAAASPLGAQEDDITIVTVIEDGAATRYFKGTETPPDDWRDLEFDDEDWLDGRTPIGYGENLFTPDTSTVLDDMQNGYLTVYLRIDFEVEEPNRVEDLHLGASYDDGFIASVNGIELGRGTMSGGDVDANAEAGGSHEYTDAPFEADAPREILSALKAGRNVLAVEVHNTNLNSSDLVFTPTVTLTVSSTDITLGPPIDLLAERAALKYFKGIDSAPPDGWSGRSFDDAEWIDGTAPIGYGEAMVQAPDWTVLDDMPGGYPTVYLRIPFELEGADRVERLELQAQYDDGLIAYVNGVELTRANMPAGEVFVDTAASSHEWSDAPIEARAGGEILETLVEGTNVLAVEVHNTALNSSDLIFIPEWTARLGTVQGPVFNRGADCDTNPKFNVADPIFFLRWAFRGLGSPLCIKACDMDDSGTIEVTDAVVAITYIFLQGPDLPPPFKGRGIDPTDDPLPCESVEG